MVWRGNLRAGMCSGAGVCAGNATVQPPGQGFGAPLWIQGLVTTAPTSQCSFPHNGCGFRGLEKCLRPLFLDEALSALAVQTQQGPLSSIPRSFLPPSGFCLQVFRRREGLYSNNAFKVSPFPFFILQAEAAVRVRSEGI